MPLPEAEARERARKIKLILFDVDGVLTDGTIWVVPAGATQPGPGSATDAESGSTASGDGGFGLQSRSMTEMKGFSAHDGLGISLARIAKIPVGFITKRVSEALRVRARDLKVDYIYDGQAYKMRAVREIMQKSGVSLDEIAFTGDDIVDIAVLRSVGLAVAVADALPQVKREAHWITPNNGGRGAGRDVIDFILESKGILDSSIERYIDESNPIPAHGDIGTGNM